MSRISVAISGELRSWGLEPFSVNTHRVQLNSLSRKLVPDPLVFDFAVPLVASCRETGNTRRRQVLATAAHVPGCHHHMCRPGTPIAQTSGNTRLAAHKPVFVCIPKIAVDHSLLTQPVRIESRRRAAQGNAGEHWAASCRVDAQARGRPLGRLLAASARPSGPRAAAGE